MPSVSPLSPRLLTPLAAALATVFALPAAADTDLTLSPVVVSGARVAHDSFDLPASVDVVDGERISEGQARVNASEALAGVPGLVVQNRQNYAQDLQISSRGFGARAAFGVRGVKLIADGIPATMPDGQGQAATFDLDTAERMEVLRGPYSAIYGNHSGGVVQLFSRDGQGAPSVEGRVQAGSYGTWKTDVTAQGKPGNWGYLLDASRFSTDGYREHSAATRDQSFAKLTTAPDADSRLTLTANGLWQHDTQDPLGLTWSAAQSDPRSVASVANSFNTRKSIDHVQGGATYERRFGEDRLQLSVYTGSRQVVQYQAISSATKPINSNTSGGVVDFDRSFAGMGARWISVAALAGGKLTTTTGFDYDRAVDDRKGYDNVNGTKGRLRRNEQDTVTSLDPYIQTEWQHGAWGLTAGLRHSQVNFQVADRYNVGSNNGDDSGRVSFSHTTPVLGLLYKATPSLNLYASAARGFETPTFNEMFYSAGGGAFNFNLQPAVSRNYEAGAKAYLGANTRMNLAVFQVNTENELVVADSTGGRTSYKNTASTLRRGVELSLDTTWSGGYSGRLALTALRAVYDQGFISGTGGSAVAIPAGNRLPGVPKANLYAELAWKNPASGLFAAVEAVARGPIYVEDTNTQQAAPGYAAANLRFGLEQKAGGWVTKEFLRVDNLFDRNYIGSVIVADSNGRFYETAPGRNWLIGASARYSF